MVMACNSGNLEKGTVLNHYYSISKVDSQLVLSANSCGILEFVKQVISLLT